MATIEDIVDVRISLGDRPITQAGFETPLILASHNVFAERTRIYTDVDDAVADGFAEGSAVHSLISKMLGGDFAPRNVMVGRRAFTKYVASVAATVAEGDVVTVNVNADGNSKSFSYTLLAAEDNTDAATALQVAIEADGVIGPLVVATDNLDGTIDIAPTASETLSVGNGTANVAITSPSSETVSDAFAAVTAETSDWFFISADTHVEVDVLAVAAYAEANKKMYVTATSDVTVWTSSTADIAAQLNTLQYDNTHVLASKQADYEFPEGGIIGAMAGLTPGTSTLHGKTLSGVTLSNFTATERAFIQAKKANIYSRIGGVGFYEQGFQVSGRFFDVIRGAMYLESRMESDIFAFIKRKSDLGTKVPYTDAGVGMIKGVMNKRLDISISQGFLASTPAPRISAPFVADIAANDKAGRLLPDITFEATLAGAVHTTIIRGYLVL